jgi:hypothetical protein
MKAGALVLLSGMSLSLAAAAQQREIRPLEGFDTVAVGGGIDLLVRQGDRFVVEVVATKELADIVTEVRGDRLEIGRQRDGWFDWADGDLGSVNVTLPRLAGLTASGGSDAVAEGTFTGEEMEIIASGGSDITIDVFATELMMQASGGSDLRVSGTARKAQAHSSGGSDLDASRLTVDDVEVHSSGGSDLAVAVRERIAGNASGGSDVTYSGDPRSVDVDASGGSDVRRR